MTKVVAVDAGHGINTPGKRTPAGEREWTFNNRKALACIAQLNTYAGVKIVRLDDPTGRTDVPLSQRTNKANREKSNVLISFHNNANTGQWGSWTGTETYIFPGDSTSRALANALHPILVKAMGLRDRGIKTANFHMLRESNAPAILTEGGFMDSTIDIVKLRNNSVLDKAGRDLADGIARYLGLKKKSTGGGNVAPSTGGTYTVKRGDTLWGIANANGLTVKQLKDLNGLKSDVIQPGQKLKLSSSGSKQKYIEIVTHTLWTYNTANWNDRAQTVSKGEVFTVKKDKFAVGGGHMYQLKSGLFVTANTQHVREFTK